MPRALVIDAQTSAVLAGFPGETWKAFALPTITIAYTRITALLFIVRFPRMRFVVWCVLGESSEGDIRWACPL